MSETGDRHAFLSRLRERLAAPIPANRAHPLPPAGPMPAIRSSLLDPDDLLGSFVRNATAARVLVHDIDAAEVPAELVDDVVARHRVSRAVVSREPEAVAIGALLAARGVAVDEASIDTCARAHLGVTGAAAALATTGTIVQRSDAAGARSVSLLPPVHLCVVGASRVVAGTTEVLATLSTGPMPSNVVFITGPSRSGDIEQIITVGVHGPPVVEVVLLRGA